MNYLLSFIIAAIIGVVLLSVSTVVSDLSANCDPKEVHVLWLVVKTFFLGMLIIPTIESFYKQLR